MEFCSVASLVEIIVFVYAESFDSSTVVAVGSLSGDKLDSWTASSTALSSRSELSPLS